MEDNRENVDEEWMEDFLKLPWRITDPTILDVGTTFLRDEDLVKCYAYTGELEPYVPLEYGDEKPTNYDDPSSSNDDKKKAKPQNEKLQNKNKHLYVTKYPHKSSLNKKQHIQCLQAIKLLEVESPLNQYSQKEQQLISIYNALMLQIHKENALFLEYVQNYWKSRLRTRPTKVFKRNLTLAKTKWKKKIHRALNYDQFYQEDKVIPLSSIKNKLEIVCDSCPLELGNIAKVVLPKMEDNPKLVSNKLPSDKETGIENEELIVTKLPVSQDIYAEHLAKQFDCSVVISSSGLKTIVDNYGPDFKRAWDLPIIVKQYDTQIGIKKIIFVDKPLTSPVTSFRDLDTLNKKLLLKTNFCAESQHSFQIPDLVKEHYKTFKSRENDSKTSEHNYAKRPKLDLGSSTDLQSKNNSEEKTCDIIDPKLNKEVSENMILSGEETASDITDPKLNKEVNENMILSGEETASDITDPKLNKEVNENMILSGEETEEGNCLQLNSCSKTRKVSMFHNVSYRIWKLKIKEETNLLLKGAHSSKYQEIKMLVRCKTDGITEVNGVFNPVTLIPKLEYQWEHGGEKLTHSEVLRQWTSLYFRPFSNLIRARIIGTHHYYKMETVNLNKIASESLKHYKASPSTNCGVIYNVLSSLLNISPGNYMLHHISNHGPFAALMKHASRNNRHVLDIYEIYDRRKCFITKDMTWNPIDTTLISSYHEKHQVAPGIFPPSDKQPFFKKKKKKQGKEKEQKM